MAPERGDRRAHRRDDPRRPPGAPQSPDWTSYELQEWNGHRWETRRVAPSQPALNRMLAEDDLEPLPELDPLEDAAEALRVRIWDDHASWKEMGIDISTLNVDVATTVATIGVRSDVAAAVGPLRERYGLSTVVRGADPVHLPMRRRDPE